MFYDNTDDDLKAIYEQLKDRYELVLTNTADLDQGFTYPGRESAWVNH